MREITSEKIRSHLTKRLYFNRLSEPANIGYIPTTGSLLMLLIAALIAFLIFNWQSGIIPPILGNSAAVSVVPLDENTAAVTIMSIEPGDAVIKFIIYNDSMGSRLLNVSYNTSIPVTNVGETSFIQVSHGDIRITAVFNDSTQKVVYQGRI